MIKTSQTLNFYVAFLLYRYRAVFKRDSQTRLDWPESGRYNWIGVSTAHDGHFAYRISSVSLYFFINIYKS